MLKINPIFSKVTATLLLICLVFVFSGLGILAVPKPTKAFPMFDWKKLLENILLSIWKFAIFPLLQKIVVAAVTTGDWFLTEEQIKKWAVQDLAFQAANSVFNDILGMNLCTKISDILKKAITLQASVGAGASATYTPSCTFDNSQIAQLLDKDPEKFAEELRKGLLKNITISTTGSNNSVGLSLEAFSEVVGKVTDKNTKVKEELSLNNFLTTLDCKIDKTTAKKEQRSYIGSSVWYKEPKGTLNTAADVDAAKTVSKCDGKNKYDKDCDGYYDQEYRPEKCKKTNLEGQLKASIKKGTSTDKFGDTITSQLLLDMIGLAKTAISTALKEHALNPLQEWLSKQLLGDNSSVETYSQSGENQLIEFPYYLEEEEGLLDPPDLITETP